MKDAYRDIFGPMLMYARYQDILDGKVTREQLMNDSSDEAIATVENLLKAAKKNIAGWEVDFGKEMMTKKKAYMNVRFCTYWRMMLCVVCLLSRFRSGMSALSFNALFCSSSCAIIASRCICGISRIA